MVENSLIQGYEDVDWLTKIVLINHLEKISLPVSCLQYVHIINENNAVQVDSSVPTCFGTDKHTL